MPAGDFYADLATCPTGVTLQPNPVKVTPQIPTTADQITATLTGDWNSGCVPSNPQVTILGAQVTVTTTRPAGQLCTFAITPYVLPVRFGPLPLGDYQVGFPRLDDRFPNGQPTWSGRVSP